MLVLKKLPGPPPSQINRLTAARRTELLQSSINRGEATLRSAALHHSFPSRRCLFLSREEDFKHCFKIKVLTFLLLSEEPRTFSPGTQDPSKHQTKQISINVMQSYSRKMKPQRQLKMCVFALPMHWPSQRSAWVCPHTSSVFLTSRTAPVAQERSCMWWVSA